VSPRARPPDGHPPVRTREFSRQLNPWMVTVVSVRISRRPRIERCSTEPSTGPLDTPAGGRFACLWVRQNPRRRPASRSGFEKLAIPLTCRKCGKRAGSTAQIPGNRGRARLNDLWIDRISWIGRECIPRSRPVHLDLRLFCNASRDYCNCEQIRCRLLKCIAQC
jgi:hypothetical protein